ncbi:MAG: nicotinamide mononucleotide transporter [Alistipes sp.]|nr:nicotinamide mononucleotide transporter [Alistipes sp.]
MDLKLILQIVGTVLGLLYLWLEYKADIRLWIVGLVMPVVHGVLYFKSGLYADCSMQLYYVLAGVYGLTVWHRKSKSETNKTPLEIGHTPLKRIPVLIAACAAVHAVIYLVLVRFTDSTVPFWDSMTTALCIVAYWMLSQKYIEQWLVWLAVDMITAGLYIYKGIPITGGLYMLYCVLAVVGYRRWLKMARKSL